MDSPPFVVRREVELKQALEHVVKLVRDRDKLITELEQKIEKLEQALDDIHDLEC